MVGSTKCVAACELETAHLVEQMQVKQGDTLGTRKKLGFLSVLVTVGLMGIAAFPRTTSGSSSQTVTTPTVVGLSTASRSCTSGADNCNVTRCCAEPGMQCYEQNAGYAGCRATCAPGRDPTHFDSGNWSCKALGNRTHGAASCTDAGSDCRKSKCCRQPGFTCYEKHQFWATCKPSCFPNAPDFDDQDATPWSCKELGQPKSTAAWVSTECADSSANCLKAGCCKTPGHQCFKQDDMWGTCMAECPASGSCEKVGARTPPAAPPAAIKGLPAWALDTCSPIGEDCNKTRCCLGMDVQCYQKDENYATCLDQCTPGPQADDIDHKNWTCKALGPRSWGTPKRGFPSLYCFSVMRTEGYEVGLLKAQMAKGVGIFNCDSTSLLTADQSIHVGAFTTIEFPGAPVVVSVDNTAGNTWLFVNAWGAVIRKNIWKEHTFTLKADPDTVMIPDRLRHTLLPYVHEKAYIVNCPLSNMMYGALEVFSYFAIKEWAIRGRHECPSPNNWGEDKYMGACMDSLGVTRVTDVPILDDLRCGGHGCGTHKFAAFHPYKEVSQWVQCYLKTKGPISHHHHVAKKPTTPPLGKRVTVQMAWVS